MTKLGVTDITLSLKFSDKEYGNGAEAFMNMSAKMPEGMRIEMDNLDEVIDTSLVMYATIWKTVLTQRWAAGLMKAEDLNKRMELIAKRIEKAREIVKA